MKEATEFILNGVATGPMASKLLQCNMNPAVLRPYIAKDGRPYVNIDGKARPVANATLRYDEWKQYDTVLIKAAMDRLVAVNDLISRGLTYGIGNGMATTVLQYEEMSKVGSAIISMDGLTRDLNDRPEFAMKYLPLPIVHSDFQINSRNLSQSRQGGYGLDTTNGEFAAVAVAEKLENMLINGASSYSYGGGVIYGYIDHPSNIDDTFTAWDASGKTPKQIVADVKEMKQKLYAVKRYGPYMLYIPPAYELLLDDDYNDNYPNKTVRQRIMEIGGIIDIKVPDKLVANGSGKERMIMVEMQSRTVRMVQGMGITPLEWQEQGGLATQYKVMTIQVPQIRDDIDGNCGVCVFTES